MMNNNADPNDSNPSSSTTTATTSEAVVEEGPIVPSPTTMNRTGEAVKQLFCGGIAGSVAKTVTAPFSRLTILFQVHSLVTTKEHRPRFAMSLAGGVRKIVERGGILSLWRGNMTSVLHRFPYSAINFYVYENALDILTQHNNNNNTNKNNHSNNASNRQQQQPPPATTTHYRVPEEEVETQRQLMRRVTQILNYGGDLIGDEDDDDEESTNSVPARPTKRRSNNNNNNTTFQHTQCRSFEDTPALHKFTAGAVAGTAACTACYPLDLVRTRLTTELEGAEHYRGIVDAFAKIYRAEGLLGFYSGIAPTLLVAVPNFAISYTVYGTLKEFMVDDDLFYNLRKIDADSGEAKLGFALTVACGAASGILGTLLTFPMDTIRRRMQVQNLHIADPARRLNSRQQFQHLVHKEGLLSLYRGLTPELLKVIPMVGTMFVVYEHAKEILNVTHGRNN